MCSLSPAESCIFLKNQKNQYRSHSPCNSCGTHSPNVAQLKTLQSYETVDWVGVRGRGELDLELEEEEKEEHGGRRSAGTGKRRPSLALSVFLMNQRRLPDDSKLCKPRSHDQNMDSQHRSTCRLWCMETQESRFFSPSSKQMETICLWASRSRGVGVFCQVEPKAFKGSLLCIFILEDWTNIWSTDQGPAACGSF